MVTIAAVGVGMPPVVPAAHLGRGGVREEARRHREYFSGERNLGRHCEVFLCPLSLVRG